MKEIKRREFLNKTCPNVAMAILGVSFLEACSKDSDDEVVSIPDTDGGYKINGNKKLEGNYRDGLKHGKWSWWSEVNKMDEAFICSSAIGILPCYWGDWKSEYEITKKLQFLLEESIQK